jgi:hypothetical protein
MIEKRNPALKVVYFVLGLVAPLAAYLVWYRTGGSRLCTRKSRVDKAHDITVEDSFPASDPPSAW